MTDRARKEEFRLLGWVPPERRIDCCGMTHIGRCRNSNEDQFLIAELARQVNVRQSSVSQVAQRSWTTSQGQLLIVADGMGGHAGGGIASDVAVQSIALYALTALPWLESNGHQEEIGTALAESLRRSQAQLRQTEGPPRMGTTVTVAYVHWPQLHIGHVGDSRCYLFRQGDLQQLTRDHTVAQQLVDEERLPREEARSSPLKDVLWNAVGGGTSELSPEIKSLELMKGDTLLLCTDGLTKHVDERTLAVFLADQTNASPTCERLIEAANAAGGTDNITVVVSRY